MSLLTDTRIPLSGGGSPGNAVLQNLKNIGGGWIQRIEEVIEYFFDHDWDRLAFVMEHQQQTEWCWSALTVSVSRYYNASSPWAQCSLVNAEFGQTTCCTNGGSAQCDQPWYPDRSLTRTGNLDHTAGAATFDQVDTEIDAGRPLGVAIYWSGGGGHAVAIAGYLEAPGGNHLAIGDPWYGPSDVAEDIFRTRYQGSGSWGTTYFTKA